MASLKRFLALAWLGTLALLLVAVTAHTHKDAAGRHRLVEPPPLSSLATPYLNLATLGHRGFYDDFATIWLLQILSDPAVGSESADDIARAVLAALRHHPQLESIYTISCFVLALDFQRPDLCENITLEGLKAFPSGWRLAAMQGYMHAYRMNDPGRGAMYYGLAASRADSPPFLKSLTAKLIEKNQLSPDDLQQTLDHLLGSGAGRRLQDVLEERQRSRAADDNAASQPNEPTLAPSEQSREVSGGGDER